MMETNEQTGKPANAHAVPMAPAIVLVEPQLGENIGFAARAMGNFGLRDLRLVTPRDGWPNEKACAAAAVAEPIVSGAKLFETVAAAWPIATLCGHHGAAARDGEAGLQSRIRGGEFA